MSTVATIPDGTTGFDTNQTVTKESAAHYYELGRRFVVRYVPRVTPRPNDVTTEEVALLHAAKFGVVFVQHVESESSWTPDGDKGAKYGQAAAAYVRDLGAPAGVTVALDLEGVSPAVSSQDIIAYCTNWYREVASAGYLPCLYVGWHCGLSPAELYRLPFERYWGAYNLNRDQEPATVGLCMKQHTLDGTADGDIVMPDAEGRLPTCWAPDCWPEQ